MRRSLPDDAAYLLRVQTTNCLGERRDVSRWYDDGSGPVWIYRDAGGLLGIIRANSWETAWEICEDSIFDDADPDYLAECMKDETGELPEGFGFRPNGGDASRAWAKTGIYSEDQNGSYLEPLSLRLFEDLGIVLTWTNTPECSEDAHCTCNDCVHDHANRLESA